MLFFGVMEFRDPPLSAVIGDMEFCDSPLSAVIGVMEFCDAPLSAVFGLHGIDFRAGTQLFSRWAWQSSR